MSIQEEVSHFQNWALILSIWMNNWSKTGKGQKKKKFTAMRLYEFLRDQGYEGSYDSVQRYVQRWRLEKGKIKTDTFIPLYFPPGDAYQFDWSHEMAVINGEVRKIKVAHFRLCHSRKFFVAAYLRETQEMVMDSHIKAFRYFGGTSKRGIYDNMSTAVISVLKGKEREYSSRFVQMCSHYLVKPVACTPGAGWEKGQVEKQVRDIRDWLPLPLVYEANPKAQYMTQDYELSPIYFLTYGGQIWTLMGGQF
ncbi:MAG: IS21 family transposase [Desulfotignum sp.]|nr:IS21 family transposase [Desulfotignum sp.]